MKQVETKQTWVSKIHSGKDLNEMLWALRQFNIQHGKHIFTIKKENYTVVVTAGKRNVEVLRSIAKNSKPDTVWITRHDKELFA